MALDKIKHYAQPWKVHEIAKDFKLLDVWEIPILADVTKNQDFLSFVKALETPPAPKTPPKVSYSIGLLISGFLLKLRKYMGKIFPLDKNINMLPIPGCKETSLKERLTQDDLERNLDKQETKEKNQKRFGFRMVYLYENEGLRELSNNTAHILMHLGWVHKDENYYTAQLAIYAKTRRVLGKLYLMLIMPFRRLVVYPTVTKSFKYSWDAYCSKQEKR